VLKDVGDLAARFRGCIRKSLDIPSAPWWRKIQSTGGSLHMSDQFDNIVNNAQQKQQQQRERDAQKKGQQRRENIKNDPAQGGGPGDDGYAGMNDREKAAYKKGYNQQ
jgi:hypothetical protein